MHDNSPSLRVMTPQDKAVVYMVRMGMSWNEITPAPEASIAAVEKKEDK